MYYKKLNVVEAWELLYRHKIVWTLYNGRGNRLFNGRTKFYFDVDTSISEESQVRPDHVSSDQSKSPEDSPRELPASPREDDPMNLGSLLATLKTYTV